MCRVSDGVEVKAVRLRGSLKGEVRTYRWSLSEVNDDPVWAETVGMLFATVGMAVLSVEVEGWERPQLAARILHAQHNYEKVGA